MFALIMMAMASRMLLWGLTVTILLRAVMISEGRGGEGRGGEGRRRRDDEGREKEEEGEGRKKRREEGILFWKGNGGGKGVLLAVPLLLFHFLVALPLTASVCEESPLTATSFR